MINIQETYLMLLQRALWGDNGEWFAVSGEQINKIIRLAAFQGTGPLVYDQLLKLKEVEIPTDIRMQMKQLCVSNMMLQQTMLSILIKAWKALREADIYPVLLKGYGLALYYTQPHLRQWGDIDLYVGKKQYHAACKVLQATLPHADHPAEEAEERKHYNFILSNGVLELHRISMAFAHPRDRRYYEQLEEQYLTSDGPSCDLEGLSITTPDDTFNVFFVFLHAWHHFIETGMNMKQLCDIAILLHACKDYIDKERLHEMLTKLHLMEAWQLIMFIIVNRLGLLREECPFYTEKCNLRANLLFEQILIESSSYRRKEIEAKDASYLKRKCLTFRSRLSDSKRVRPYVHRYARHMVLSDILHGIERTLKGK